MGGLFQKALELRNNSSNTASWGAGQLSGPGDRAERREILKEVEAELAKRRLKVSPQTFTVYPRKKGGVLPLFINAAAILTVVIGAAVFLWFFERQQETIVVQTERYQTAEGRLVEAIRQESEQQIAARDREILEAQSLLEQARAERDRVQNESRQQLLDREAQLRSQFEAELEAERARLIREGVSGQDLEEQLRAFEARKQAEYDTMLNAVQAEVQRELQEKEAAVAGLIQSYESSLTAAQEDRERLQGELARREAELIASSQQREQDLAAGQARLAAELEQLAAQREREQLTLDQILSFYDSVNRDLRAERYDQALASLDSLRDYLDQPQVASLPAVQRRRSVEIFIIASLRQLVEREAVPPQEAAQLVESAEVLARVGGLIDRGNAAYNAGNTAEARSIYEQAMQEIPEIAAGYERLRLIEDLADRALDQRLVAAVAAGDQRYVQGDYQASIDRYAAAIRTLGQGRPAVDRMAQRIVDAGFQLYQTSPPTTEVPPEGIDPAVVARLEQAVAEAEAGNQEQLESLEERNRELAADVLAYELEFQQLQAELEQLRREKTELETQLASASGGRPATAATAEEIAALQERNREIAADLAASERRSEELEAERERVLREIDRLRTENTALQSRIATESGDREAVEAAVAAARVEAEAALAERDQAVSERDAAVSRAAELRAEADEAAAEQQIIAGRIAALKRDLGRAAEQSDPTAQDIRRLLEAKIVVEQLIDTEAVKNQYPSLSEDLDQYFDQRAQLGREQALSDVLGILDHVEGRLAAPDLSGDSTERALLTRILTIVETMVQ